MYREDTEHCKCSQWPKAAVQLWRIISGASKVVIRFEGEMSIRTLSTTLLQMFCKIILHSQVIVKGVIESDKKSSRCS